MAVSQGAHILAIAKLPGTAPTDIGVSDTRKAETESIGNYEQDTNRLARGISEGTVVVKKDGSRVTGIPVAGSIETWSEPLSPFGAAYPFNHVYETPNGLLEEFDDTPGNMRYHRYHPAGTYAEVDVDGTEVRRIVGDNYYIVDHNGYISINGEANITVGGKCKIYVINDAVVQIDGNLDAMVKGDINLSASGNFNLNVKDTFKIKADNIIMETNKYNHTNTGEVKLKTMDWTIQSNNINTKVLENINTQSKKINITTSEEIVIKSSTTFSATGSNKFIIGGSTLHINPSTVKATTARVEAIGSRVFLETSTGPDTSTDPAETKVTDPTLTGMVLPSDRANPDRDPKPALLRNNRFTKTAMENEFNTSGASIVPGQADAGTPYIPSTPPGPQTPIPSVPGEPVDDTALLSQASFTGEEQLSKYIKLKDVTYATAVSHYRIQPNMGLTEGQIAANLKHLAINVLDKLIEKYGIGSFIITSAFRPGQGQSQHGLGQAVDIQFKISKAEYPDRHTEVMGTIPFDQCLLEYQTTGTGRPWIHISYNSQGNRRQYFTMSDHKRVSNVSTA